MLHDKNLIHIHIITIKQSALRNDVPIYECQPRRKGGHHLFAMHF